MEQSLIAQIKVTQRVPARESSFFWGLVGLGVTALSLVIKPPPVFEAVLLLVAWVCLSGSCWIAFREREQKRRIIGTALFSIMIGLCIFVLWAYTQVEPVTHLSIEGDKMFLTVFQNDQPVPPKVSRFARIKVGYVGGKSIANVKATVTRVNDQEDWQVQLPLSSNDTLFLFPTVSLAVSADLNSGDSQYFDAVVECNGEMKCPKGQLAIPSIEGRKRSFVTPFKPGSYSGPEEFTVRASGDGVSPVTKTFVISVGPKGQLLLDPKPDE